MGDESPSSQETVAEPEPVYASPRPLSRTELLWVLGCKIGVGSFLALMLLRSVSFAVVEVGTVGVRYNTALGLEETDLAPGYYMELLGVQKIWRMPSRYLFINYTESNVLSIRTKDNNTVDVDVSIPYRIKPGHAWRVMAAGNHLAEAVDRYRFQRFAEDTATSVLRGHLAQLRSEDFYHTDRRLKIAAATLVVLNKKLAPYHLEARTVVMRAAYFRPEYEDQLAQIQFNEQQKLLDDAKRAVATRQQSLDNYHQQTHAMVAAKEQAWAKRISQLDRAYQVGMVETGDDRAPGAARRRLNELPKEQKAELVNSAALIYGVEPARVTDAHLLGIKNIEAETTEYASRVIAEAEGVSARLAAEGTAQLAQIHGNYEGRVNALLDSPAGRAYVAYTAADNVQFAPDLTFQSGEGLPSVLRLGEFARRFMQR